MEKLRRNGKVGVLVSPGYGAGWSTWNGGAEEALLMDARLVQAVLDGDQGRLLRFAEEIHPNGYWGGAVDLKVEWVPEGAQFWIDEYDGSESLVVAAKQRTFTA